MDRPWSCRSGWKSHGMRHAERGLRCGLRSRPANAGAGRCASKPRMVRAIPMAGTGSCGCGPRALAPPAMYATAPKTPPPGGWILPKAAARWKRCGSRCAMPSWPRGQSRARQMPSRMPRTIAAVPLAWWRRWSRATSAPSTPPTGRCFAAPAWPTWSAFRACTSPCSPGWRCACWGPCGAAARGCACAGPRRWRHCGVAWGWLLPMHCSAVADCLRSARWACWWWWPCCTAPAGAGLGGRSGVRCWR